MHIYLLRVGALTIVHNDPIFFHVVWLTTQCVRFVARNRKNEKLLFPGTLLESACRRVAVCRNTSIDFFQTQHCFLLLFPRLHPLPRGTYCFPPTQKDRAKILDALTKRVIRVKVKTSSNVLTILICLTDSTVQFD